MALKLGTLQVDFEANTTDFKKAEREVNQGTSRIGKGLKTAGVALAAFVSVQTVARLVMLADNLAVAERRIALLSDSAAEANKNLTSLKQTANDTGQEFGAVFSVFEGFKRVQDDIGATDQQILDFTDTLSKLGIIGGSSGTELSNALRQLNQGLAGGILRAEEFNSIIENTPEIAVALAKGLGKSLGELRGMVLEGELLADDVFNAILSQTDQVNDRFETIPKSLGQLFQETKNILVDIIGNLDKMTMFTGFLGDRWAAFNDVLSQIALNTKAIGDLTAEEAQIRQNQLLEEAKLIQQNIKELETEITQMERMDSFGGALLGKRLQLVELEEQYNELLDEVLRVSQQIVTAKEAEKEMQEDIKEEVEDTVEAAREYGQLFNITEYIGLQNLKIAMQEANAEFERLQEAAKELDTFDDVFADMESAAWDFDTVLKQINDEQVANLLDLSKEIVSTWGKTFDTVLGMADQFHNDKIDAQIAEVKASTELSKEEKEERIKQLEDERKKLNRIQRIAFTAKKLANIAEIAIDTARNVTASGGLTPLGIAQGVFGATQIAAVAAQSYPGRVQGGNVPGGALVPVNENGEPEMLSMGSKQYLLTGDRGGRITSGRNLAANDSMMPNIVINNLAPGTEVVQESITREEVVLMVKQSERNAVSAVNRSIRERQGSTANALRSTRRRDL